MAQAWTAPQDQRSDFVLQNPSNSHEDVDLARWELAELLKHSDGRSEIVYAPHHIANPYNGYGGNNMGDGVNAHNQQAHHHDASMNGPMNPHLSQNHSINGHGQQNPYDVYSGNSGIPSRGYPADNLGIQSQQSMYSSPSLNGAVTDPSSFHHNSAHSFTMPQDYSFSSIPRNTSSMSDLRRIAGMNVQNGYRGSDYQDGLGGMNSMDGSSLNAHAQPQQSFPDFPRYQQQNVYTSAPPRHGSTSTPFSPSQNDMMQDVQAHPAFHNQAIPRYDNMSNFSGTNPINGSSMEYSRPDARASSVDTASESQGPSSVADPNDFHSFIRRYLDQYARTPNRLAFGERSIIIMSSKVAQKSYGNEKRFLCPPPTAVMVGNSWWSEVRRNGEEPSLAPPRVVVSISGEPTPPESSVEWAGASGKPFDATDPPNGTTFVGRCVGKQLFISEADEKRKKVEALVKVTAPSVGDEEGKVIGLFPSKPIKVISKPSKKRQSAKNLELCINHGSTVSLFHRLRSQTVSTKYLCVSASGSSFKGSDGAPLMGLDVRSKVSTPAFVARTSSWDPFIMYIVDVNKPVGGIDAPPPPPPQPDYPSPPPNAIQFTNNGSQIPIYYNQTIVLQCLTSGVVSPILIIRKVDHQTTVVGGGIQEGGKAVPDHYCAPGEVCGDPVSQLHKIAFEVYESNRLPPEPGTPGTSGAFLSCMAEKVNTYRPVEGRQWTPTLSLPLPNRGSDSPAMPGSPAASTPTPNSANTVHPFGSLDVPLSPMDIEGTNDGGRVKKGKRATSSAGGVSKSSQMKGRPKRPHSAGSGSTKRPSTADGIAGLGGSGALWQVDIGETSVWTIVGTEQVRYNFYVPPVLFDQRDIPPGLSYPVPNKPVTPFPGVVKYLPPDRASEAPKGHHTVRMQPNPHSAKMLTVYGENFSKADPLHIFFGSEPSPYLEVRCSEVMGCLPPETEAAKRRPIILVREDGVVFPSSILYP